MRETVPGLCLEVLSIDDLFLRFVRGLVLSSLPSRSAADGLLEVFDFCSTIDWQVDG